MKTTHIVLLPIALTILAIYLVPASQATAQDETATPNVDEKANSRIAEEQVVPRFEARDSAATDDSEKSLRQAAEDHVRSLELRSAENEPIDLIEHPLFAFGDAARVHNYGTLWAWGKTGRPAAVMELWRDGKNGKRWMNSITLTSPQQVVLATPTSGRWQPTQMSQKSAPISGAPAPANKDGGRLRQLRELARRFTAHELWQPDDSRYELRILVQPVHRYSDNIDIQDGAVFVIAYDTNPEALLLIEALGPSLGKARWHYSLARSTHAELHVEFDGQEIWTCGRADTTNHGATKPYWLFVSPAADSSLGAASGGESP
jgi:hypothetical protein